MLHDEYDAFVAGSDISDELRFWAAEQKMMLLVDSGKHAEAEAFLTVNAERFQNSSRYGDYEYLQAWIWFSLGRLDDAERLLRTLRDELVPGYPLYARTGWLLGKILLCALGIGLIAYHQGASPKHSSRDVSMGITATILWSTLYVLVVHFTFAFFEF